MKTLAEATAIGTRIGQVAGAAVLILLFLSVITGLAVVVIVAAYLAHVGWNLA